MMDPVDQRLSDHYQGKTLNSARLESILAESQRNRQRRKLPVYAAVAAMLMVVFGALHQYALSHQQVSIALREAAMNHLNKLQLDAQARTLAELQLGLGELPFKLELPDGVLYKKLALIGGRYCTISGNLAAHLKFADPDSGEQFSLFMTPTGDGTQKLFSDPEEVDGVEVKLWQEKDVVYAMAKSLEINP